MALVAGGRLEAADRAFAWLAANQAADGTWPAELGPGGVPTSARVDTNCTAYIAVGVWHRFLCTGDRGALEAMVPINRASGHSVGVIASLDLFMDDIFPDTLGRPIFPHGLGIAPGI